MTATFIPRLDILPHGQKALWPSLAAVMTLEFVLYGGTAIALQLGHRESVDFDFFSHNPLDRAKLFELLPDLHNAKILQEAPDTLTVETAGQVKLSFFGGLGFGRVAEPLRASDTGLEVASLLDLMITKLKVIMQRIESKDYRDIAAMLDAKIDLADGLAGARALYGLQFQPSESLKALTWFEGGDLDLIDPVTRKRLIVAAASVKDLPNIERLASRLNS
jgi:Nucleotidyl transferase AbiEii toxin, Type IV TA system